MKIPITIIVPIYKVEIFLKDCLDSIMNQTYKNFQCILVDDCSPDNCGKICDEYAKIDNRFLVVHKEKNEGLSEARNTGLNLIKAGTSLEGMSHEDVLYNDFKLYTVDDKTLGIGQFFTTNFDDIKKELAAYLDTLDREAEANNYYLIALYITDIIQNGSYILYNRKAKNFIATAYDKELEEGAYLQDCVSRKKNVVPILMSSFDK